jgi:glycosyltransferase involved in cell wall biosynthesis
MADAPLCTPLVSVIMPAYNAAPTIRDSIESVRAQSFTRWELIVVDDGSADETAAMVEAVPDDRIRLIRAQTNGGRGRARNIGLDAVRGEFVSFLDADDHFYENLIEAQLAFLAEAPFCDAVGCAFRRVALDGSVHRERLGNDVTVFDPFRFLFGLPAFLQGTVYRRDSLEGLRFSEGTYGEDVDFNLRYVLSGNVVGYNRQILWDYRETPQAYAKTTIEYCRDQIGVIERNEGLIRSLYAGDSLYEAAVVRAVLKVASRSLATGQFSNLQYLHEHYGHLLSRSPRWIAVQEGRDIARWRANFGTLTLPNVLRDLLMSRTFGPPVIVSVSLVAGLARHWHRRGDWRRLLVVGFHLPLEAIVQLKRLVSRGRRPSGRGPRRGRRLYDRLEKRVRKLLTPPVIGPDDTHLGWELGFGSLVARSHAFAKWIRYASSRGPLDTKVQRTVDMALFATPPVQSARTRVLEALAFVGSDAAKDLALATASRENVPEGVVRLLLQARGEAPRGASCRRLLRRAATQPFLARDLVIQGVGWPWLARITGIKPRRTGVVDASQSTLARASVLFETALIAGAHDDADRIFATVVTPAAIASPASRRQRRRNPKRHERVRHPEWVLADFFNLARPSEEGPFVVAGSLLGLVREGGVLAHDNDIDVGVLGAERYEVVKRAMASDPRFVLIERGVDSCCRFRHVSGGRIDFYRFDPHGSGWIMRGPTVAWSFPHVEPEVAHMNGVEVAAPRDGAAILQQMYGDWRVPDPGFDSRIRALNLVPDAGWYGVHGWRLLFLELLAQGRVSESRLVAEAALARGATRGVEATIRLVLGSTAPSGLLTDQVDELRTPSSAAVTPPSVAPTARASEAPSVAIDAGNRRTSR